MRFLGCNEHFLLMPAAPQAEMLWVEECGTLKRPPSLLLSARLSSPAHSHAIIFPYQNFAKNYMFQKTEEKDLQEVYLYYPGEDNISKAR